MKHIYIFPSTSRENIITAIESGIWAVPIQKNKSAFGKSKNIGIGDEIALFHSGEKILYGMLKVTSLPDPNKIIDSIWSGNFELPFGIAPDGPIGRVSVNDLNESMPSLKNGGNWTDVFPAFRPLTIFASNKITEEDYAELRRLISIGSVNVRMNYNGLSIIYDDVNNAGGYIEGSKKLSSHYRRERSEQARLACLRHYGPKCAVCDIVFGFSYATIGEGFMHVHHLSPLGAVDDVVETNPINDMRPVCPNCHAMIHRGGGCRSLDEVKKVYLKMA